MATHAARAGCAWLSAAARSGWCGAWPARAAARSTSCAAEGRVRANPNPIPNSDPNPNLTPHPTPTPNPTPNPSLRGGGGPQRTRRGGEHLVAV